MLDRPDYWPNEVGYLEFADKCTDLGLHEWFRIVDARVDLAQVCADGLRGVGECNASTWAGNLESRCVQGEDVPLATEYGIFLLPKSRHDSLM